MTKNKKVPALRFPGFEGEWEVKRLGELCSTFKSGTGITSGDIHEIGAFPVYGGNGLRGFTDTFTHDGFFVLIGRQGALCGNINRARGKSYISEHAVAVSANETSDTEWLAQKLDYYNLNRLSESSAQPGLSVNKLVKLKIVVPTLPEQQKIAAFLTAIDIRIQQLTRKKALLEQFKKGVMQRIFSREIRFKDEKGKEFSEWEVRKIGDIFKVTRGNVLSMTRLSHIQDDFFRYPVYSSQTKNNGLSGYYNECLFENAITWTTDGANAGDVNYRKGKFYCTNVCGVLLSDEGCANACVAEILASVSKRYVSYVGNPKLMNNVMAKIKILLPKSVREQQQIATFLTALDTKINHLNDQITHFQTYKKGLLQQMFV